MLSLRHTILVLLAVAVAACSPKREERKQKGKELTYTARTTDTKLKLPTEAALTKADGDVATARVLEASEALGELGLAEQSRGLLAALYSSAEATYPLTITQAPYVGAAAGATYEDAKVAVQGFSNLLTSQEKQIKDFLAANPLELPEKGVNSVGMIEAVEAHIQKIKDFVNSPAVHPLVRKEMLEELRREADLKLPPLKGILEAIEKSKTVGDVLKQVDTLVEAADTKLDDAARQNVAFGEKLHRRIETAKESGDVLEAVVMIWEFLTPAERDQLIKPASKELYDFLHGQEAETLDCMARRKDCDAIDWGQKFFVEMKIDQSGIPKLQTLARGAVRDGSLKIVRRNVRKALLKVPNTIHTRVTKNFGKYSGMLKEVLPGYKSLMETILTGWAKKDLGGLTKVHGFETRGLRFGEHGSAVTLTPVQEESRLSDARTLGLSLTAKAASLAIESDAITARRGYFEVLNKLLALGGYRDQRKALVPALTVPFTGDLDARLDLEKAGASTEFFALPDLFRAPKAGPATGDEELPRTASAEAQAELLRGLARVIPLLKDWSKTSYDDLLGGAQAGEYLPKAFEGADLALPLFPKAQMFSLAVANSAVLLLNLKSGLAPAFLAGDGIAPAFLPEEPKGATMAGVVDIKASENGPRRGELTTALGISKTIIALTEFLEATADLKNTGAKALTAKSEEPGAKSAVELITAQHENVRALVLALANMLNQKLAAGQDGVAQSVAVEGLKVPADQPKRLVDQVYAIRAFLRAGELLKSPMYKQFAVEAYHFMNAKLYRADLGFYAISAEEKAGAPDWLATAQTLAAIQALVPTLEGESRAQAKKLLDVHTAALKGLKFSTAEASPAATPAAAE